MNRWNSGSNTILVTALLMTGCGGDSPTTPALSAPTIAGPAMGETVENLQPTLTVSNSTGGVGEPTYQFEIATDVNFTAYIAEEDGIGQGTDGTTSWKVPAVLTGNTTYYWRARASATGETSPFSPVANFKTLGGFMADRPQGDGLLIFDPLTNGMSVGEVGGGTFNSKGWMATAADTYIRYALSSLPNGFVEFDVTNLRNPNPVSQKRALMIMWDPTFGEYTYNRYRMHLAKYDDRLVDRWQVRLRFISRGQEHNTGYDFYEWKPNRIYTWRVEWGAFPEIVSTQRVRVLLDGMEIMARNYDPVYNLTTHWIELGMAPRQETLEQAIFSNVKIGVRRP